MERLVDTNNNNLKASEICAIVKLCAKSRVKEFHLGSLRIVFSDDVVAQPEAINSHAISTWSYKYSEPQNQEDQTIESTKPLPDSTDDDTEQLVIEDPLEWEKRELEES